MITYANQLKSVVEQFGQINPDRMSQGIAAITKLVQELSIQNCKLIKKYGSHFAAIRLFVFVMHSW